jgi:hypothetical protein
MTNLHQNILAFWDKHQMKCTNGRERATCRMLNGYFRHTHDRKANALAKNSL